MRSIQHDERPGKRFHDSQIDVLGSESSALESSASWAALAIPGPTADRSRSRWAVVGRTTARERHSIQAVTG